MSMRVSMAPFSRKKAADFSKAPLSSPPVGREPLTYTTCPDSNWFREADGHL